MLEYSVYIHLLGVGLVFAVAAIVESIFAVQTHLSALVADDPQDFFKSNFAEGVLLFTLYPFYVIVASVLLGAYNVPHLVATGLVRVISALAQSVGKVRGFRWIKPPSPDFPVEPVWYKAFHVATDGFERYRPEVVVKMKRGDTYYGVLESYPLLPDTEDSKDFLINYVRYVPAGYTGAPYDLNLGVNGSSVLLNSGDVDSIQIYYIPVQRSQDE